MIESLHFTMRLPKLLLPCSSPGCHYILGQCLLQHPALGWFCRFAGLWLQVCHQDKFRKWDGSLNWHSSMQAIISPLHVRDSWHNHVGRYVGFKISKSEEYIWTNSVPLVLHFTSLTVAGRSHAVNVSAATSRTVKENAGERWGTQLLLMEHV